MTIMRRTLRPSTRVSEIQRRPSRVTESTTREFAAAMAASSPPVTFTRKLTMGNTCGAASS